MMLLQLASREPEPESGSELELPPESESVILGSLAHSGRACDGLPVTDLASHQPD